MISGLLKSPQCSLMGFCVVSHPPLVGGDSQIECDASRLAPPPPHVCVCEKLTFSCAMASHVLFLAGPTS